MLNRTILWSLLMLLLVAIALAAPPGNRQSAWDALIHDSPALIHKAFDVSWHSLDGGGGMTSIGGEFEIAGTIGQPDAGVMDGEGFTLTGGFWAIAEAYITGCPCVESNALFADFTLGNLDILTVVECRDNSVMAGLQYVLTDGTTVAAGSGTWTNKPLCGTNNPSENAYVFLDITPEEDEVCRELLRQACPTP